MVVISYTTRLGVAGCTGSTRPGWTGSVIGPAQWTLNTLSQAARYADITVGRGQVRRILLAEKVRWRRTRSWAASTDPEFVPKGPVWCSSYTAPLALAVAVRRVLASGSPAAPTRKPPTTFPERPGTGPRQSAA